MASTGTTRNLKDGLQGLQPVPEVPQADIGDMQDGVAVRQLLSSYGGTGRHLLQAYGGTGRNLLQAYGGSGRQLLQAYGGTGRHLLQGYGAYALGLPYTQDGSNRRKLHEKEHAATIGRSEYIGQYGGQHKRAGSYGSYGGGRVKRQLQGSCTSGEREYMSTR